MSKESYAKQPLLYIDQPEVGKVTVSMQSDYISSKNNPEETEDIEELEDELSLKTSIKEKLEQILTTLDFVPTLKCSIETEDDSYTALLKQFDKKTVTFIDFHTRFERTLPLKEIKKVKTISF